MHSALNIKNLPEKEVVKHKGKKKLKITVGIIIFIIYALLSIKFLNWYEIIVI